MGFTGQSDAKSQTLPLCSSPSQSFYLDLLFYHLGLRCYVVSELKAGKVEPGHASQLNMYLNVVDDLLRHPDDKPSIGLLLVNIGKYLSGLGKLDHVFVLKAGFETQLRPPRLSIPFRMRALGMTCEIRDGLLQRVIKPCHIPSLQSLDNAA